MQVLQIPQCKKFSILIKELNIFLHTIKILAQPTMTQKITITVGRYTMLMQTYTMFIQPYTTFQEYHRLHAIICIPLSPLRNVISFLFLLSLKDEKVLYSVPPSIIAFVFYLILGQFWAFWSTHIVQLCIAECVAARLIHTKALAELAN